MAGIKNQLILRDKSSPVSFAVRMAANSRKLKTATTADVRSGILLNVAHKLDRVSSIVMGSLLRSKDNPEETIAYARLFTDVQKVQIEVAIALPDSCSQPLSGANRPSNSVLPIGISIVNNHSHDKPEDLCKDGGRSVTIN